MNDIFILDYFVLFWFVLLNKGDNLQVLDSAL